MNGRPTDSDSARHGEPRATRLTRRGALRGGLYAAAALASLSAVDVLSACGATGGGGGGGTSSAPDDVKKAFDGFVKKEMPGVPISLLEAAKQEGTLTAYLLVPDFNKELVKTFQEKFPFVQVQATQLVGGSLTAKFNAELRSSQPIVDVAQFSALVDASKANSDGFVLKYKVSSEPQLNLTAGVKGAVYPVTGDVMTISYNSQKIKDADAAATLRSWDGILDNRWSGKSLALGEVLAGGTTQLLNYYLFKKYGTNVWKRLAKNGHGIYPGGNPELDSLASGEHDIAYGVPQSLCVAHLQQGQPVHWTNPGAYLVSPYLQVISAKAKNKNAAKLFQEFAMTPTAQAIFAKYGTVSYRKGFKAATDFSKKPWYNQPDPAKFYAYTDTELSTAMPDIAKQWRAIIK